LNTSFLAMTTLPACGHLPFKREGSVMQGDYVARNF
jgi:hypothetical protein